MLIHANKQMYKHKRTNTHTKMVYVPSRLEREGLLREVGVPGWGEGSLPPFRSGAETNVSQAEVTSLFTISFSS